MRRAAALAVALASGALAATLPPVHSPWVRQRTIPPATPPRSLDPLASAPLRTDAGTGTLRSRVEADLKPLVGARVYAVEPPRPPESWETKDVCDGSHPRACVCGDAIALAQRLDRGEGPPVFARATTGDGGTFVLEHLPSDYGLWIEAPAIGARWISTSRDGVYALSAEGTTGEGDVVDESRQPVAGAIVSAYHATGFRFEAVTDAKGHFKLGPLGGVPMRVFVRRNGYLPAQYPMNGQPMVLRDPRELVVWVRDAEGNPAPGVPVRAQGDYCTSSATTDEKGRVVFTTLRPGNFEVTAGTELMSDRRSIWLAEEPRRQLLAPLRLHPTAAIDAELDGGRNISLLACEGAPVRGWDKGSNGLHAGFLEPGRCNVYQGVKPVWVSLDGGEVAHLALHAVPLAPSRYEREPRAWKLRGRVLQPNGAPAADVPVSVWCDANGYGSDQTDARGTFALSVAGLGTCTVTATQHDGTIDEFARSRPAKAPLSGPLTLRFQPRLLTRLRLVAGDGGMPPPEHLYVYGSNGHGTYSPDDAGELSFAFPRGGYHARAWWGVEQPGWHAETNFDAGQAEVQIPVYGPPVVSGTVVDAEGRPVTDFEVNGERHHDDAGRFAVRVSEGLELFNPDAGWARRRPRDETELGEVRLGFARLADLQVLDADGGPVTTAVLDAVTEPWSTVRHGYCLRSPGGSRVDPHGRGGVVVYPSERIRVTAPGYLLSEVDPDGGVVRLERGRFEVRGRVMAGGRPAPQAEVCLAGDDGAHLLLAGADGSFTFTGLGAGVHHFEVFGPRDASKPLEAPLEANGELRVGPRPVTPLTVRLGKRP